MSQAFDPLSGLNPEQRRAAAAQDNAVCSAGAGAGKTFVLTRRYLHLLQGAASQSPEARDPIPVDGILALTFTRKAAGEMYSRIYQAVLAARDQSPQFARAAADFESAKILTLDSFSRSIASAGSSRYGIPPNFRMDEEELLPLIRGEIQSFIGEYSANDAFRSYCRRFSLPAVWTKVLEPLGQSLSLPVDLSPSIPELFEADLRTVEGQLRDAAASLNSAADDLLGYFEDWLAARNAAGKPLTEKQSATVDAVRRYAQWSPADGESPPPKPRKQASNTHEGFDEGYEEAWTKLTESLSVVEECRRFLEDPEFARQLAQALEEFRQRVVSAKRRSAILSFNDTAALAIQVLMDDPGLADYYRRSIRAIMIDEFQDNNALQKSLLYLIAAPPGFRQPRIPRVDEIRPDVLFFVGDQKQSIYRFRGADVRVFKELSGELSQVQGGQSLGDAGLGPAEGGDNQIRGTTGQQPGGWGPERGAGAPHTGTGAPSQQPGGPSLPESAELRLSTNYRSHPVLIDYFNGLFRRIFQDYPGMEPVHRSFEAEFEAIGARQPDPQEPHPILEAWIQLPGGNPGEGRPTEGSAAEARPATEPSALPAPLSPQEAECRAMALRIRKLLSDQTPIWDREAKVVRPVRESDIGILLRTGGNQMTLERMLRLFGIGYQVQNDRSLFLDATAADLGAFIAVLVYANDRESWATLARSPLLNLSIEAIVELGACADPTSEPPRFADPQDQERWQRFQELLQLARPLAIRRDPGAIADLFWDRAGYSQFVQENRAAQGFTDQFENLRAFLAKFRGRPLTETLQALRENLGRFEKVEIEAVLRPTRVGVTIMTVHGSKGLEFPVVFLGDLGTRQKNQTGRSDPGWISTGSDGLPRFYLNPGDSDGAGANPLVRQKMEEGRFAEWAEFKRLFYVACTRAENHLFFFGSFGSKDGKVLLRALQRRTENLTGKHLDQSFLSLLLSAYVDELDPELAAAGSPEVFDDLDQFADGLQFRRIGFPTRAEWLRESRSFSSDEKSTDNPAPENPREWKAVELVHNPSDHGTLAPESGAVDTGALAGDAALLGSLTHWVLETLLGRPAAQTKELFRPPPPAAPAGFWERLPGALANRLESAAADSTTGGLRDQAWTLARQFFASDFFTSQIVDQEFRVHTEVPFLLFHDERWVRGSMDLVLELPETGQRWVVDYKTDTAEDAEYYAEQLRWYLRAAEDMVLPGSLKRDWKVRGWIVYLRTGRSYEITLK